MGTDYGLTPELGRNYAEFITSITDQYMISTGHIFKHSEFKDPNAKDYETMDTQWDWDWDTKPPWSLPPFPGGDPWEPGAGGETPPPGGGLPTVKRCNCAGMKIKYVTQTMTPGQKQTLTLTGISNINLCSTSSISWTLSGGGSIHPYDGFYTVYTAPSSYNCTVPATITADCWGITDQVSIVTTRSNQWGNTVAYTVRECQFNAYCSSAGKHCSLTYVYSYNCVGSRVALVCGCGICHTTNTDCGPGQLAAFCLGGACAPVGYMECEAQAPVCPGCPTEAGAIGSVIDKRTGEMSSSGCCPAKLVL